jgi:hypothetical protein
MSAFPTGRRLIRRRLGYRRPMTDYSEEGAIPVDDAAVDEPPTEQEVREAQERKYPEQAATADGRPGEPEEPGDEGHRPTN